MQRPSSFRPKPVHPGRRAGHRAAAAAVALGLLASVGVLPGPSPALAARSGASIETAQGGSGSRGGRGVESWVTNLNTAQRLAPQPIQGWESGAGPAGSTVVVDPTRRYQTMIGFGASMTDTSAWVLTNKLSEAARRQTMTELFSTRPGNRTRHAAAADGGVGLRRQWVLFVR